MLPVLQAEKEQLEESLRAEATRAREAVAADARAARAAAETEKAAALTGQIPTCWFKRCKVA